MGDEMMLVKPNSLKIEIHAAGCAALNRARKTDIVTEVDAEELADAKERGYKITTCKCTK